MPNTYTYKGYISTNYRDDKSSICGGADVSDTDLVMPGQVIASQPPVHLGIGAMSASSLSSTSTSKPIGSDRPAHKPCVFQLFSFRSERFQYDFLFCLQSWPDPAASICRMIGSQTFFCSACPGCSKPVVCFFGSSLPPPRFSVVLVACGRTALYPFRDGRCLQCPFLWYFFRRWLIRVASLWGPVFSRVNR